MITTGLTVGGITVHRDTIVSQMLGIISILMLIQLCVRFQTVGTEMMPALLNGFLTATYTSGRKQLLQPNTT